MLRLPLKYRITAAFFILAAVILAVVLSQALSQYYQGSREQIIQHDKTMHKLLGEFARIALLTTDYEAFQPHLEQVSSLPDVLDIVLADDRNIIVVASNPIWIGQSLFSLNANNEAEWQMLSIDNAAGPMGVLATRFSNEMLLALHLKVRTLALAWSLGGLIMIALASILMGHLLTRRLEKVSRTAEAVAAGDLAARTSLSGHDEVAELGRVFDGMLQRICDDRRQLEEREQYLSLTLDSIGDAVIATDAEGHISRMNPIAEYLTGWSATEAHGRLLHDVFKIISAQTREPAENPVNKVLDSGEIVGLANHTVLISKDSTEHQIADSAAPIRDDNGKTLGVILVFRDVTLQYQTEEALRRSQKMEAIGQLSGGIAHDFNNQLGVIIGYLDFLKNHFSSEDKPLKWITAASKATQRCIDLTRQLLAVSRRQTNETTTVNLNQVFDDLKNMIARSLTPEVEVQYFLADDLWPVDINPGEFQDAMLNLVINARDAMPAGGKVIIETSNVHLDSDYSNTNPCVSSGDYLLLTISDTGTGMDKKVLEHIFEPFYTTKPEGKGTGLGLAMVYGFVKRYDGNIKVYSEPGTGTSIRIYLPRSTVKDTDTLLADNSTMSDLPTGRETVLVVDDETSLLNLADLYLRDLGYKTHLAENATQALHILEKHDGIDLLFTDVVMPGGMNGYELAQQVTQIDPGIKVLLTSGFSSKIQVKDQELTQYSTSLLNKPYRKGDLARRIRHILDT